MVVYKVDRLTRSLTDFAKLVELFDAHGVSFVSVTQAFNTTTSMGRLTLNVLLSFAQFEREVIGERVKDKIAASKRKGLWMGGLPPLGYANRLKKLEIVPEEAETVRYIFRRYLELGTVGLLLQDLDQQIIKTKARVFSDGRSYGGVRFGKGALVYLLKNRCYIGEIFHRNEIHMADHEPIIERDLFDAVQVKLRANATDRKLTLKASPYLLTGLIFDSIGNPMSPAHTNKKGVRYRYYVSQATLQQLPKEKRGEVERVSAPDVETVVERTLRGRAGANGWPVQSPVDRDFICAQLREIVIRSSAIVIRLRPLLSNEGSDSSLDSDVICVPWTRKPAVAVKGIALMPTSNSNADNRTILAAIGKARLWVREIMSGIPLTEIAAREGKGERQIRLLMPLAFISPAAVRVIIERSPAAGTVTSMARNVALLW